jgi:hypothetical protein
MSCTNRVSARPGPQGRRSARGDQHRDSLHCRAAKRPQWLGGTEFIGGNAGRGRSAPHRQAPRTPIGAGGGRSEPVRLGVHNHHRRSWCRKSSALSNAVAGLAAVGSSLDRREIAASGTKCHLCLGPLSGLHRHLREILGNPANARGVGTPRGGRIVCQVREQLGSAGVDDPARTCSGSQSSLQRVNK